MSQKPTDTKTADKPHASLARVFGGHKATFTRNENELLELLNMDKVVFVVDKDLFDQLKLVYKRLDSALVALEQFIVAHAYDDEGSLEDLHHRYDRIRRPYHEIVEFVSLSQEEQQVGSQISSGHSSTTSSIKLAEGLKPFTLTAQHNPIELNDWIRKFTNYYQAAKLDSLDVGQQQAHFMVNIDTRLSASLQPKIAPGLKIFGDTNSCMDILRKDFLIRYPIVSRRYDFFNLKKRKSETPQEFLAYLQSWADMANIRGLTYDDIVLFTFICGLDDEELRRYLLELDRLTIESVTTRCGTYQSTRNTNQRLAKAPGKANAASNSFGSASKQQRKQVHPGQMHSCAEHCSGCHSHQQLSKKQSKSSPRGRGRASSRNRSDSQKSNGKNSKTASVSVVKSCHPKGSVSTPRLSMTLRPTKRTGGCPFKFFSLPDTGASRTIISADLCQTYGWVVRPTSDRLLNASDEEMIVTGFVTLRLEEEGNEDETVFTDALVTESMSNEVLVSWHDLEDLGIVNLSRRKSAEKKEDVKLVGKETAKKEDVKLARDTEVVTPERHDNFDSL